MNWLFSHGDQIANWIIALFAAWGGLGGLWKAIKKKFHQQDEARANQLKLLELRIDKAVVALEAKGDNHEKLDQERHAENKTAIQGLTQEVVKQRVALAALGWRNGTGHIAGEDTGDH